MNPLDFLKVCDEYSNKSDEYYLRTSINRAYYAILNYFCLFLQRNGISLPRSPRKHKLILEYFNNSSISKVSEIASELSELRKNRNDADYEMEAKISSNKRTLVVMSAKVILEDFKSIDERLLLQNIQGYRKGLDK